MAASRLVTKAQWAQVVDPQKMIGVGVSVKHRIEPADIFTDRLLPEIRSGINQDGIAAVFNEHRRPSAPVAGIT